MKPKAPAPVEISELFAAKAVSRLLEDKSVRRKLPIWGRLHIDRQLPFLCVYRRPPGGNDIGTDRLLVGEASYLLASGVRRLHKGLVALVTSIAKAMTGSFGSFLLVEIWSSSDSWAGEPPYKPFFKIVRSRIGSVTSTVERLERSLREISTKRQLAGVELAHDSRIHPPGLSPLLPAREAQELGWHVIGLEVRQVFREPATGEMLPLVHRALRRGVSRALQRSFFEFTRTQTTHRPPHYQALGRRSMVKAVWEVDRKLAETSSEFDFLLLSTPTNTEAAWRSFQRNGFQIAPKFSYRPLPVDPALLKRKLYAIPIERIEDPTLEKLFRDQQTVIDRKLTMLGDRTDAGFLYGGLQLYGPVGQPLLALAESLLQRLPSRSREDSSRGSLDADAFAARALEEIAYYRRQYPQLKTTVEVRDDVAGLMVSRGNVLVGKSIRIPASRVEALLSHEVGTHVLTYVNGRSQPLRQLYIGLPGYDELQEGLAVLSEFLVGGLSRPRLRLLAGRVIAAQRLIEGASFVEIFRELTKIHRFANRVAFTITMRICRCGGLTKDAVYLRGLDRLLSYFREGGDFEILLLGKFGAEHVPIMRELQWRHILNPGPLRPRYLEDPLVREKLRQLAEGLSVIDLARKEKG